MTEIKKQRLMCRRCRKVTLRSDLVDIRYHRDGYKIIGCPNCRATVFSPVNEDNKYGK
jgi:RNase P subunit RPR2